HAIEASPNLPTGHEAPPARRFPARGRRPPRLWGLRTGGPPPPGRGARPRRQEPRPDQPHAPAGGRGEGPGAEPRHRPGVDPPPAGLPQPDPGGDRVRRPEVLRPRGSRPERDPG